MKYIVYKTVNLVNHKIYIGVHGTKNPDVFDGYIGCGINIHSKSSYSKPTTPFLFAVHKYGVLNFKRYTLKIFNNSIDAYKYEEELVNNDFINRDDTYNALIGGTHGHVFKYLYQFNINGKLIKIWNGSAEAANFYNISSSAIFNALRYKHACKNSFWSHCNLIDISKYSCSKHTECYKYNASTGEFIESYQNNNEAAIKNNVELLRISRSVIGGYKVEGYIYSNKKYDNYKGKDTIYIKNKVLYIYNLNGDFVTSLKDKEERIAFFKTTKLGFINVTIRKGIPYKEWQISLEFVDKMPKALSNRSKGKPVLCFDINNTFIKRYNTVSDAIKDYGTGVLKCLYGYTELCKQYKFVFEDQVNDIVYTH